MSVFLTQPMQTKHFLVHIGVGLDQLEYKSRGVRNFCVNLSKYPFKISVKLMVPIFSYNFPNITVWKFKHFLHAIRFYVNLNTNSNVMGYAIVRQLKYHLKISVKLMYQYILPFFKHHSVHSYLT